MRVITWGWDTDYCNTYWFWNEDDFVYYQEDSRVHYLTLDYVMRRLSIMTDYEESYKNYLAWLTPRELLKEYKIMRFPWRYRERKWIKEEIESRCIY